jgi:membrane fusion protein (multidrug efflux system)
MKPAVNILIAVLLAAASGTANAKHVKRQRPPTPVETAKAVKKVLSDKLSLFGNVRAGRSATVRAEIEGAAVFFDKEVGDKVKKGETVCRISDKRYTIAVEAAKANLKRAEAAVEKARLNVNRITSLFERKIASREQLDEADIAFKMAEADMESKKAALKNARLDLELTNIKAPYSGFLAGKHLQKGDWAKAGNEVFDIVDLSSVYVNVPLPEKELDRVKTGSPARVWMDAFPGEMFSGEVTKISPRTSKSDRSFETRIDINDPGEVAKAGLFARVEIVPEKRAVLMVSKDAIVERGPLKMVFIINDDIAHQVNVSVLDQRGGMVAVRGKINAGDEVAVTGNEILRDGAKVHVTLHR